MSVKLREEDFAEGGLFQNVNVSHELPIPTEILTHVYGDCNQLDKIVQINLLKYIWNLKGITMYPCLCRSHDHLLTKEQYDEQQQKNKPLHPKDFEENGVWHNISFDELPPIMLKKVWGDLSYFDLIPDGKCFKSVEYQLKLLQQFYFHKYKNSFSFICTCKKHLVVPSSVLNNTGPQELITPRWN